MCPPHREGFLHRFGLKTGIHFAHFALESGMAFWGKYRIVWTSLLFQFQMSKTERKILQIRNGFEEFFSLRSNLSNDNIISAWRPGLKTGMDYRGLVRKRVWKITFFGLKSGQDLENRAAHPHQEFPRVPPPLGETVKTMDQVCRLMMS